MAADPDDADRDFIAEHMDADLQFILSDAGVSTRRQAAIARHYGTLRKFNAIGDDRAQIRTACLQDFAIPQDTPENRAEVASIVAAWETAKEFVAKEIELRAEAKVLGQPKILQSHERQSMIRAIERVHGALGESETPSADYLALKSEETELNEPTAAPLDEIISRKDTSSAQIQSTVDSSGHLRVTRTKSKAKMPATTEEYRKVMRVAMFSWLAMSARYKAKNWLQGLEAADFNKFVDFILGERVLGIQIPSATGDGSQQRVRPDWAIVLAFEYKLRKEAMRLVTHENHTLSNALRAVIKDADLKEAFFTTPVALRAAASSEAPQNKWPRYNSKGSFSGKFTPQGSKGKGKSGKSKGKDNRLAGLQLAWRTPDGRDLCFGYNSGNCDGKACNRVHQCRVKGGFQNQKQQSKQKQSNQKQSKQLSAPKISAVPSSSSNLGSTQQLQHGNTTTAGSVQQGDNATVVVDSSTAGSVQQGGSATVVDLTVDEELDDEQFNMEACMNYGRPIQVEWDGKTHEFVDGFGMCSPTRWSPLSRGHGRDETMQKLARDTYDCLRRGVMDTLGDVRLEAFKLVTGKMRSSPFTDEVLQKVRGRIAGLLRDPADAMVRDEGQPFFLRLLAQWLDVFGDPDVHCLVSSVDSYAAGVNVGVDTPLPRSPQVFPEKRKHRKLDGTEFNPIADNYSSAQVSSKELEEKFREEESLGRMFPSKLSVLRDKYGGKLRVAAMAAIVKPDGGVRPLHDATHSVMVNHAIKYRDQLQCPGPAEVASIVREAVESREAPFCVSADIRSAHRLVKIREDDWGYICCRSDSTSDTVWVNKTGTFGVSSAPYWWAKLFAAIGRFVGHVMQMSVFWHMVYVDDLHGAFTGGLKFEMLWIRLLAFEVIGTPFGYHKFKGGFSSDFVGFHLRYDRNEVGITTKRGSWLADWIRGLEEKRFVVAARDFSEFLGRLGFVSQLLTWMKPHLAPLFAWASVSSSGLVGRLPDTVILTLKYILAEMESQSFMVSAKRPIYFSDEQFRTDAKCTDEFVVIAGWELKSRRWFSLKLSREQVPYLFKPNGGGSQWASTSAELLASMAALKAFGWFDVGSMRRSVNMSLFSGTDNRSNDFLTTKRSTTKWPLMLLNLQLSASLSKARLYLDLRWRPREENTEADALTNENFEGFAEEDRVNLLFQDMDLSLVEALWGTKLQFDEARQAAREAAAQSPASRKRKHDKTQW
eukprot:s172_g46.t1